MGTFERMQQINTGHSLPEGPPQPQQRQVDEVIDFIGRIDSELRKNGTTLRVEISPTTEKKGP